MKGTLLYTAPTQYDALFQIQRVLQNEGKLIRLTERPDGAFDVLVEIDRSRAVYLGLTTAEDSDDWVDLPPKSLRERAKERGIVTYDTALPQGWLDKVRERIKYVGGVVDPVGHVVWCYDPPFEFGGCPRAVTPEGDILMGFLAGGA